MMIYINPGSAIEFDYVNWKGTPSHRRVIVNKVLYGNNRYHPQPQWLIEAQDIDRNEVREFAMRDMTNVQEEYSNRANLKRRSTWL